VTFSLRRCPPGGVCDRDHVPEPVLRPRRAMKIRTGSRHEVLRRRSRRDATTPAPTPAAARGVDCRGRRARRTGDRGRSSTTTAAAQDGAERATHALAGASRPAPFRSVPPTAVNKPLVSTLSTASTPASVGGVRPATAAFTAAAPAFIRHGVVARAAPPPLAGRRGMKPPARWPCSATRNTSTSCRAQLRPGEDCAARSVSG